MTTHVNGEYYVGRHSTIEIEDNYFGSGNWVTSIKDKSVLSRTIIKYCDTFEELLTEEQKLIDDHIDNKNCMNLSKSSAGILLLGDSNPMKREEVKDIYRNLIQKRMETGTHYSQTEEGKLHLSNNGKISCATNHPLSKQSSRDKVSKFQQAWVKSGTHPYLMPEVREKSAAASRTPKGRKSNSDKAKKQTAEGKNKLCNKTCPHCGVTAQWYKIEHTHFDNCNLNPVIL